MAEQPNLKAELAAQKAEPLLPVEKKLIGWSFGLGVVLLVLLALFNGMFPPG